MAVLKVPHRVIALIKDRVESLFSSLKGRFLGPSAGDKRLTIRYERSLSLPGMYESALRESGGLPNLETLTTVVDGSKDYLDALKLKAVNTIVKDVEKHLGEHDRPTPVTINRVLKESWEGVTASVKRVVDTETQTAKGLGSLEGIVRANASIGIDDPYIVFVVSKDEYLCLECKRIHLMSDGNTPRVFKLSEVSMGYHVKGEDSPSGHGLHPSCRCIFDKYAPVVTETGVKPLCKVRVGDRVLTHTGKFKKVLDTFGEKGKEVSVEDDLYRIEFRDPSGKIRKLRTTADHLMLTQSGWVRTDCLVPGSDSLQYLFKECKYCSSSFPHSIGDKDKQFCSLKCYNVSRIGVPRPEMIGREQSPEEIERRRQSLFVAYDKRREKNGTVKTLDLNCLECNVGFKWTNGFRDKNDHWHFYYTDPKYCSKSCASRATAREQWKDPNHREKVSKANSVSMLKQYKDGVRKPGNIEQARKALYKMTGGSKDQLKMLDLIKSDYSDAEPEFPIGPYFADVCIPSKKVVVEWDGGGHWLSVYKGLKTMEQKVQEDADRDEYMRQNGWHVLRFNEKTGMGTILSDIYLASLNSNKGYSFGNVEILRVVKVKGTKMSKLARLYDLTVEDDESFVVMGIVSHNCTPSTILPDWGFDSKGKLTYVGKGHLEYNKQRGLD
jgi:hypothetical protein